jgi:hypothetical protein
VVHKWIATIEGMASKWGVDLHAVEKAHPPDEEFQS